MMSTLKVQDKQPLLGFDPCSSFHLACRSQELENSRPLPQVVVTVATGEKMTLTDGGDLHTVVRDLQGNKRAFIVKGIYKAPQLEGINLLSMGLLDAQGFSSLTSKGKLAISSNSPGPTFNEGVFATGYRDTAANIFLIHTNDSPTGQTFFAAPRQTKAGGTTIAAETLHQRLGHCGENTLQRTADFYHVTLDDKNKST